MLTIWQNLFYFVIFTPILIGALLIAYKFNDEKYRYLRFGIIIGIFLLTRIFLTIFNVGIFPSLVNDILFYVLAFTMGMVLVCIYAIKIENKDLKQMFWWPEDKVKRIYSILFGIGGAIVILLIATGLMSIFGPPAINLETEIDGIIVAIFFGLGAIYEEIFFRSILQNTLTEDLQDENKAILIQALLFTFIHLFYLPFDGYGILYLTIFLMALILGFLKSKQGLVASILAHGLFVFLASMLT